MESPYYECHITLTPVTDEELKRLREALHGSVLWRIANFALLSDRPDALPKMFVSARSDSYRELHGHANIMMKYLNRLGFSVTRIKIESTIFDLKF